MAKQTGLGDQLDVAGFDLSGDVGSVQLIRGSVNLLDLTGIDKSAMERGAGLRDGEIGFNSFFNDVAGSAFRRLSLLPTTDVIVTYWRGNTDVGPAASLVSKQVNYDHSRGADGALLFATQALSQGFPLEWGKQIGAGKRTDSSATTPASGSDFVTVSTAFGASIYVQLLAFTGTSVTFTLRDSADNSSFADVTGGASSALTAIGAERWATTATETIRRYLAIATSGTFSNAVFRVMVARHSAASL